MSSKSTNQRLISALQEARAALTAVKRAKSEPIAIIGMGCRFPKGESPESFWHLLRSSQDAITDVPASRWDIDAYYDPDPETPGKMYARQGGFLEQIDHFDAEFFGISPREALKLDPQQRLLLEVSWEALERAGQAPSKLFGSATGVFVGISSFDYALRLLEVDEQIDAYVATGSTLSPAAGRLSYLLGLTGPSMAVDTACSSSLVATHLAVTSLRQQECNMALVGGVNVLLGPKWSLNFAKARMLAPDSRCKTFDAAANGYVRSEGCGVMVLKRLSDALACGDNVLAVIRGSAVNQDGASGGLTVPSGPSQEAVIRQALKNAGISPAQVSYIEAHGTGTSLGDPIEMDALEAVFGHERKEPLLVGSVKTNIGHLEAGAGIAGLIKTILSLQHGEIPPHLHFDKPNPHISWQNFPVKVPTERTPFRPPSIPPNSAARKRAVGGEVGEEKRIAGVSSFGFSGTNAHIVLEEAPASEGARRRPSTGSGTQGEGATRPLHLLTLSAKTESALEELVSRYVAHLGEQEADLADICFTAYTGREHFNHRLAVVGAKKTDMMRNLNAFKAGHEVSGLFQATVTEIDPQATWLGMGRNTYLPSLRTDNEWGTLLLSMAQKYVRGIEIDWASFDQDYARQKVVLPTYPFQRERYWVEAPPARPVLAANAQSVHPLLHNRVDTPKQIIFDSQLSANSPAYLAHHRVSEAPILPASAYLEMVLAASAQLLGPDQLDLSDVSWKLPLSLPETEVRAQTVQLILTPDGYAEGYSFEFFSRHDTTEEEWRLHAQGLVRRHPNVAPADSLRAPHSVDLPSLQARYPEKVAIKEYYQEIAAVGMHYGPSFQAIDQLFRSPAPDQAEVLGRVSVPEALVAEAGTYTLHPVLLDACFQLSFAMIEEEEQLYLPFALTALQWYGPPDKTLWVQAKGQQADGTLTVELELFNEDGTKVADVEGLTLRATSAITISAQRAANWESWLYQLLWQAKKAAPTLRQAQGGGGCWLILADESGIGQQVAHNLAEQGVRCVRVFAGTQRARCQQVDTEGYEVNPLAAGDFERLIEAIEEPIVGIVHLWSLDQRQYGGDAIRGCASVLHLVQALQMANPPRLWLVTRGAQNVAGEQIGQGIWQAPLWGLGRVIREEHPELKCVSVDLAPEAEQIGQGLALFDELWQQDGEDEVAFRDGKRYVARLEPARLALNEPLVIDGEGCYLITGGLGTLGRQMAEFLVAQGARHLLLTGRRGAASDVAQAAVRELEEKGALVTVVKADVSKSNDVARVLEAASAPLAGVIHAAGVLDDGILREQSLRRFEKVMAPKVQGAWNLHQQTLEQPLDFFVLFSSAASLLGSAGQGNYAAANAFMDALAHYRSGYGLPALAINWGPWANTSMTSTNKVQRRLANSGWGMISPLEGWQIVERLLKLVPRNEGTDAAQVGVLPVKGLANLKNIKNKAAFSEKRSSLTPTLRFSFKEQLEAAPASQRRELLINHLREQIARVIGSSKARLKPSQRLFDLGLDSLMALELKKNLEASTGYALHSTLLFDYPTLGALENYLSEELLIKRSEGHREQPDEPTALSDAAVLLSDLSRGTPDQNSLSDFDQFSKNDLLALLNKELANIESEI